MFGWLIRMWQSVAGTVSDNVRNWVLSLFQGHYGYLHSLFWSIRLAWDQFYNACNYLLAAGSIFIGSVYRRFQNIEVFELPALRNWVAAGFGRLINRVHNVQVYLTALILKYHTEDHNYTYSVFRWVIVHVLLFLLKYVLRIVAWITREGDTMWHYFTHLADFAELLFGWLVKSLEKHAWDVGRLLGTFFLALVVRNLIRFITLMEDVIDAVL